MGGNYVSDLCLSFIIFIFCPFIVVRTFGEDFRVSFNLCINFVHATNAKRNLGAFFTNSEASMRNRNRFDTTSMEARRPKLSSDLV